MPSSRRLMLFTSGPFARRRSPSPSRSPPRYSPRPSRSSTTVRGSRTPARRGIGCDCRRDSRSRWERTRRCERHGARSSERTADFRTQIPSSSRGVGPEDLVRWRSTRESWPTLVGRPLAPGEGKGQAHGPPRGADAARARPGAHPAVFRLARPEVRRRERDHLPPRVEADGPGGDPSGAGPRRRRRDGVLDEGLPRCRRPRHQFGDARAGRVRREPRPGRCDAGAIPRGLVLYHRLCGFVLLPSGSRGSPSGILASSRGPWAGRSPLAGSVVSSTPRPDLHEVGVSGDGGGGGLRPRAPRNASRCRVSRPVPKGMTTSAGSVPGTDAGGDGTPRSPPGIPGGGGSPCDRTSAAALEFRRGELGDKPCPELSGFVFTQGSTLDNDGIYLGIEVTRIGGGLRLAGGPFYLMGFAFPLAVVGLAGDYYEHEIAGFSTALESFFAPVHLLIFSGIAVAALGFLWGLLRVAFVAGPSGDWAG